MTRRKTTRYNFYNAYAVPKQTGSLIAEIPMPTDIENRVEDVENKSEIEDKENIDIGNRGNLLENIFNNLQVEELILLAMIFLILQDGVKDEFLLIILVYILIAGN